MSENNFLRLFPEQEGYRMFLLEVPGTQRAPRSQLLSKIDYRISGLTLLPQLNDWQIFIV